jgi:hypothetical protein
LILVHDARKWVPTVSCLAAGALGMVFAWQSKSV